MEEYVCTAPFTLHVCTIRDGYLHVRVKLIEAGQRLELVSFHPWTRSVDMYCGKEKVLIPETYFEKYLKKI